uniref:Uncharacterized protein n=1 Tax=Meloidogyne hapla TaxID=6305 RepID=A0A1I8BTC7_MELHA
MKRPEPRAETRLNNFMEETRQGFEASSSSSFNYEYSNKKANISKYSSPSTLFYNRSTLPQTSIDNKNKKQKYEQPPPYSSIKNIQRNFDKNNNSKQIKSEDAEPTSSTSKEIQQQFCNNKKKKLKNKIEYTWNEQRVLYNLARQVHFIADYFRQREEDTNVYLFL